MTESDTYIRTVQVPLRTLTAKKAGLLNRAMKDYLRARKYAAEYYRNHDVFDVTYSDKNDLYKEIRAKDDVELSAKAVQSAIDVVEENYKGYANGEFESPPEPQSATTLALDTQDTYLFYDDGYYMDISTGVKPVKAPLITTTDAYHTSRLPKPDAIPPDGRIRNGSLFFDLEPADFPKNTAQLSESSVDKVGERQFVANLVFRLNKQMRRSEGSPKYIVGVDRGRNALAYACLYDCENDHVEDWVHINGDGVEHYMDEYTQRINDVQQADALHEVDRLRTRRFRYKKQKDYEIANRIVDLARERLNVVIALEELSGMRWMGNHTLENRRFHDWSYYRLEQFIKQKAEPHDISVTEVDPHYTSQDCSRCGSDCTERHSVYFHCSDCGYEQHADANAAVNIAKRA